MNKNDFQELLDNRTISELYYFDEIGSTNDEAKKLIRNIMYESDGASAACGEASPMLFIADTQVSGRGRMGRSWSSPPSTNISMSLVHKTELPGECIPGVTILAALAVTEAIKTYSERYGVALPDIYIKWPNDVIINNKKLCGILTELEYPYIICGIGINVNASSFPKEIQDKATSLAIEGRAIIDRGVLAALVTESLTKLISTYEDTLNLSFIIDRYNSLLISKDKEVILTSENIDFPDGHYISRGIDMSGALIVEELSSRKTIPVRFGEVSVRGLYGYT